MTETEIQGALEGLKSATAKRREAVLKSLAGQKTLDARVVAAVRDLAAHDGTGYVRSAAGSVLTGIGEAVPKAELPPPESEEGVVAAYLVVGGIAVLVCPLLLYGVSCTEGCAPLTVEAIPFGLGLGVIAIGFFAAAWRMRRIARGKKS